ncbi:universal stress protein [Nonomuraea soli]|uniref:Nucleotide-binding universal stress UspA family protein n=1 Tax=Nonomuraea soli TaxID=1032476 RepID=A0A7W0HNQ5_9ACTN|nr:universal stress protein [Nonomuraea soli]MBA2889987.1 nucleotide-binding universal stress UspA family protein [Nonomuraea soli]
MIIVGVDGSEASRAAVEWAADDACRTGEPLRLVHAVDRWPYQINRYPAPELTDWLTRGGEKILAQAEEIARVRQPHVEVSTALVEGPVALTLRDQAKDASAIVVGSRGLGGFAGALLGSVSVHVAGHAHCPVVVVHADQGPVKGLVVVGVDDSPECEPALEYAFGQAAMRGARVMAVHGWQLPMRLGSPELYIDMDEIRTAQHRVVTDRLAAMAEKFPQVQVDEVVRNAHPVDVLVQASAEADLVVVGSHGRGAVRSALLGSVSRGVLHHARCAVAVVRS